MAGRTGREAPDRVRWAVSLLPFRATDRVLDIGSGSGASVELVLPNVPRGRVIAIDRSAAAVERIRARVAESPSASRVEVRRAELADPAAIAGIAPIDIAFAVDVNTFWTGSGAAELAALRAVVAPGGTLLLAWGAPAPGMPERDVVGPLADRVLAAGFASVERLRSADGTAVRALG